MSELLSFPELPASYLAETRVPEFLAGAIAPVVVASFFVLSRAYSRAILIRGWGYDDTAIIIAWISSLVLATVSSLSTRFGNGRHVEAVPLSQAEPGLKLVYVSRLLYLFVITACKYAFCASYLRIFRERSSRLIILCLTGFITLYTLPIFFATAFPCLPPSRFWDLTAAKACEAGIKATAWTYVTGVFNALGDTLLLGFVIPQILPLKMPRKQKIALISVVSLSVLVIIAAIVRMVLVTGSETSDDPTWVMVNVSTWSAVEVNTALVCVSAPATKPLIRKAFPGVFTSSDNQSYGRGTHGGTISNRKTRKSHGMSFGAGVDEHGFDNLESGLRGQSLESSPYGRGKSKAISDDSGSERFILTDSISPVKIRGEN